MFRYFVDVHDLRGQSTRSLPLRTVIKFRIPLKKGAPPGPRDEVLQVEDGAATIEGKTFDDVVIQLRGRYPDELFERTLRRERDYKAEHAMSELVKILARAAVAKHLGESETVE